MVLEEIDEELLRVRMRGHKPTAIRVGVDLMPHFIAEITARGGIGLGGLNLGGDQRYQDVPVGLNHIDATTVVVESEPT